MTKPNAIEGVQQGPKDEPKSDLPPPRRYNAVEIIMRRAMSPPDGDPANWTDEAKLDRILAALDAAGLAVVSKDLAAMDEWIQKWTFPGGIYDDAPPPPRTGPWPGKTKT